MMAKRVKLWMFLILMAAIPHLTLYGEEVVRIICTNTTNDTSIVFRIAHELSSLEEFKTLQIHPGNDIVIKKGDFDVAMLNNVVVSTDGFGVKRFISLGFSEALLKPVADITLDMKVGELSGFYSIPKRVEISGQHIVDHIDKKTIDPDQFMCEESIKSSTTIGGEDHEPAVNTQSTAPSGADSEADNLQ